MISTAVTVALSVAYFALGWALRGIDERDRRARAQRLAVPVCSLGVVGCTIVREAEERLHEFKVRIEEVLP